MSDPAQERYSTLDLELGMTRLTGALQALTSLLSSAELSGLNNDELGWLVSLVADHAEAVNTNTLRMITYTQALEEVRATDPRR